MKNVYEIRKEKNLYFILPDNCIIYNLPNQCSIAVIVNLYYVEDAKWYLDQLYQISDMADVYVVSSVKAILNMVSDENVHLIEKENRGRDISALLVSCKDIIPNYEYVCFLHDKKALNKSVILQTKLWIENMWSNMIGGRDYIKNVINILRKNANIGLLVPPEPAGLNWFIWGKELWRNSYEITKNICDEWGLNCNIDCQIPPITIGTAFWCKTKALKKLFERDWKYEDFPEEPLPSDGTLSHAIERVFAYVAQDAGYDTGTVMGETYAAKQMLMQQEYIPKAFEILHQYFEINTFEKIDLYKKRSECMRRFCDKYKKIYLYGAGTVGKNCLAFMKKLEIEPNGVVVSKCDANFKIDEIPVFEIDRIDDLMDAGIIVSVGRALKDEIVSILVGRGVRNYICYVDLDKSI